MNALEAIPAETAPIEAKEPRLSAKLRKALHLLETGECSTQRAAAERAGMSEFQLSRRLREPQIQVFIARRRSENISVGSLRASRRFVQLIDATSEHVAAQVSERILKSEGVLRSDSHQVSVNIDIKAGYVIDLTDAQPMRTVHTNVRSDVIDG
jgi:hypothetical protein